jgi:hypothetical protein
VSPLQAISPEYHPASPEYTPATPIPSPEYHPASQEYIPGRDPYYPEGPADAFFAIHADGAGSSGVGESVAPSSGLTQPTVDIHGEEGGAVGFAVLPEQTPVASISAITQPVSVPSIAPPVPVPAAALLAPLKDILDRVHVATGDDLSDDELEDIRSNFKSLIKAIIKAVQRVDSPQSFKNLAEGMDQIDKCGKVLRS